MSDLINERLRQTVAAAYTNAPAIRARFDAAGVRPEHIQSVDDLAHIPILPKDDIIALQQANPPFGGLLGVPLDQVRHIFFSPGPIYEPDAGDDSTPLEMAKLTLQRAGFQPGDIVLNTMSYHLVPAGWLVDHGLTATGCTAIPGGTGNTELQLKLMRDLRVNGYTGTPSFLLGLIEKAEELGLDFKNDFYLKKAAVMAEPLLPRQRQLLTQSYGLSICNAYATAEFGILALNLDGSLPMQLLPEPVIQVADPASGQTTPPGEVGEVVITNLNPAYPLIRLGLGDLAVNVDPNPGRSKQDERAIILVGRRGEAVKVRGMFVHPNQLRLALGQVAPVQAFQGIVTRPENRDHFTLRVALAGETADPAALVQPFKESVRRICRVRLDEVVFVEAIPAEAPGMVDAREWV
ncbi:MAG: phenylacetate--CoA ligase family protein [Chloroflexi bacterium]|nr:phenylacetate--CoA ligase family protein [Chloroflexota bacterium]MCI0581085.1 phenylacetate--CoA ligase family protein [Chloroflexota bacterium]MCI0645814.1 phenylacetate--CoA ligase family protein [Chloroflexota bacterium]MCI0727737.1 phenylacetate--CoA ligase family protein [Chloroflexota bacterium]